MSTGIIIVGVAIIAIHVIGVGLYWRGIRKKIHKIERAGICVMSLTTIATIIFSNYVKNMP